MVVVCGSCVYGNDGNVDAHVVPLWITGIPGDSQVELGMEVVDTDGIAVESPEIPPPKTSASQESLSKEKFTVLYLNHTVSRDIHAEELCKSLLQIFDQIFLRLNADRQTDSVFQNC